MIPSTLNPKSTMNDIYKESKEHSVERFGNSFGANVSADFIIRCSYNLGLAHQFIHCVEGTKYFIFEIALKRFTNPGVLLYIAELRASIMFENINAFEMFNRNVLTKVNAYKELLKEYPDGNIPSFSGEIKSYTPYQIILTTEPQKIMFSIKGTKNNIMDIQKYCSDFFGKTVTYSEIDGLGEMTVDIYVDKYQDSIGQTNLFKKYISDSFEDLFQEIEIDPLRMRRVGDIEFIKPLLKIDNYDQIVSSLKAGCIANIHITQNYIINNNQTYTNCNNTTINNTNITNNVRMNSAKNWIKNKKIKPNTSTKELYEEYANDMRTRQNTPIYPKIFNEIVENECGYIKELDINRRTIWAEK